VDARGQILPKALPIFNGGQCVREGTTAGGHRVDCRGCDDPTWKKSHAQPDHPTALFVVSLLVFEVIDEVGKFVDGASDGVQLVIGRRRADGALR
jgi:hypothetical protein